MMATKASKVRKQVMISSSIRALIRIFIQHLNNKISIIEEICLYDYGLVVVAGS